MGRPGLGGVRPESDQATCQFLEDSEQIAADGRSHEQPSRQAALQVGKGIGAVDLTGDRQERPLGGLPHCQGMQVIGQHLGPEALLCRQPRQAGGILQRQPVLEPFEGLLNAPSAMVQIGKVLSGILGRIHQRRHHRMDSAIRRHHAHGCRGAGAFVVGTIGRIGRAEGYHGLRLTGAQAGPSSGSRAPRRSQSHRPACRRESLAGSDGQPTRVPDSHDPAPENRTPPMIQMLEQHLPLADTGRVPFRRQGHLDAKQIEGERDGFTHLATGRILKKQAQFRGIGGHYAQAVPARHRDVAVNQGQQVRIQAREGGVREVLAGLREGLSADVPNQVGLINQVGEADIPFVLNAGLEPRQHGGDQDVESQSALAKKGVGLEAGLVEEFGGVERPNKLDKNAMALRSSW